MGLILENSELYQLTGTSLILNHIDFPAKSISISNHQPLIFCKGNIFLATLCLNNLNQHCVSIIQSIKKYLIIIFDSLHILCLNLGWVIFTSAFSQYLEPIIISYLFVYFSSLSSSSIGVELSASVNNIYSQLEFSTQFFTEYHFHLFFKFFIIFRFLIFSFSVTFTVLSELPSSTTSISYL